MTIYLDCNATAPLDEAVRVEMLKYFLEEYGNAGSRTHVYGARAKQAAEHAREQVAAAVDAKREEIIFTSGATESDNLAILGLAEYGQQQGRRHIISTRIEHKAVLEPLEQLQKQGFKVTLLSPGPGGRIEAEAVQAALRSDTLLVSVMQVNNETGVRQPISEIADVLADHPAFFHVDAAQGFGKENLPLRSPRLDLISISGHKIYGPKGIGALVTRRRGYKRPPLSPLLFGGGQEYGLRPGTLPVPLVVGLGVAAAEAERQARQRAERNAAFKQHLLDGLAPLNPRLNGDPEWTLPHIINLSFPGVDSEAVIVALKEQIAISNGSACTSQSYQPSHVLQAMGLPEDRIKGALRLSWCHLTEEPDWADICERVRMLSW